VNWNAWQGAVCLLCSVSCANTGRNEVTLPLFLAGTNVSTPLMSVGDIPVRITRADLAFGPLYLCAGNTAGDLCDTARLEWLDTAVVDTTSVTPRTASSMLPGACRSLDSAGAASRATACTSGLEGGRGGATPDIVPPSARRTNCGEIPVIVAPLRRASLCPPASPRAGATSTTEPPSAGAEELVVSGCDAVCFAARSESAGVERGRGGPGAAGVFAGASARDIAVGSTT